MMNPRSTLSPWLTALGLALLIASAHGTAARAQGHTPDPYRPYNSVYDPFVAPVYPTGEGYFPNQSALEGRSGPARANQFQNYLDELNIGSDPSGLSKSLGAGTPYHHAFRRFDPENGPNRSSADRLFRERQQERDERYFEARKKYQEARDERDPKKRARLIREYAVLKRRAERDFSRARGASTPARGAATETEEATDPAPPFSAGPFPSPSAAAPAPRGDAVAPETIRPRTSSPIAPRRGVGSSRTSRTPSQILRESERLDRRNRLPAPTRPSPPRPRLESSPDSAPAPR